jgi:hypothetical protein
MNPGQQDKIVTTNKRGTMTATARIAGDRLCDDSIGTGDGSDCVGDGVKSDDVRDCVDVVCVGNVDVGESEGNNPPAIAANDCSA